MQPHLLNRLIGRWVPEELKRRIRDAVSDRNLERPQISAEARARLLGVLRPDILKLQDLIGRDLSAWLD
jgi:hypothetical protein